MRSAHVALALALAVCSPGLAVPCSAGEAPSAPPGASRVAARESPGEGKAEAPDRSPAAGIPTPGPTEASAPPEPEAETEEERKAATRRQDLEQRVPSPAEIPPTPAYPIDLYTALRLADAENPTIAAARARIAEALAAQTAARVILLPSLNAGSNLRIHTGNLQRSSGRILNVTEQSLYFGGGSLAFAAGTVDVPAVNIFASLTEAWFEPLAAHQFVVGNRFRAMSTANEVLQDVAVLYLELLARQEILEIQRLNEKQVYDLAVNVNNFAIAGERRIADANRAQAEWKLHRAAVQRAEEEVAVVAARFAARLNLDPSIRLHAAGGALAPIDLIDLNTEVFDLVQYALRQRPDLAARAADVERAEYQYRREVARPLLPTLWMGYSGGAFGGGSNVVPPLMGHFGGRSDFDVRVYWTLMNLGAGNLSLIHRGQARVGEAEAQRVRAINQARREIAASRAEALAERARIEIARRELASAESGFREDRDRSRQNLGRPIEVLNSLNLVATARVNVVRAVMAYDQAQFRLFVALGSPPPLPQPAIDEPSPPPVTTPLHGPLPVRGHPIHLGLE
ncbi:TolC family protein [Aquisphaera giovannonii]|uniref:TolC family protein n=1 Tax=Aquisphaera giovannonii TaxID=406548 RepID=UPI0011DF7A19|nr:TolC family protein [Aquisphaera giovannonii]